MKRTSQLDLAEDVALVTFIMYEALILRAPRQETPFRAFDGFPSFCAHAGAAGVALHRAFQDLVCDAWIDIVIAYAEDIVRYALAHGCPADDPLLAHRAGMARRDALCDNLVHVREARS